MNHKKDRLTALMAAIQSLTLIEDLALRGTFSNQQAAQMLIKSTFIMHPKTIDQIYEHAQLQIGAHKMVKLLGKNSRQHHDTELVKTLFVLLKLSDKIKKNQRLSDKVQHDIEAIYTELCAPASPYDYDHPHIIHCLSQLYQKNISALKPRIHIKGHTHFLQNHEISDKIRALLFAGIRAMHLWQQLGGKRWHLIPYVFQARKFL